MSVLLKISLFHISYPIDFFKKTCVEKKFLYF